MKASRSSTYTASRYRIAPRDYESLWQQNVCHEACAICLERRLCCGRPLNLPQGTVEVRRLRVEILLSQPAALEGSDPAQRHTQGTPTSRLLHSNALDARSGFPIHCASIFIPRHLLVLRQCPLTVSSPACARAVSPYGHPLASPAMRCSSTTLEPNTPVPSPTKLGMRTVPLGLNP